ncbi:MAG: hypothetical protein FWE88_05070 [Phycisphaerae bacterium]|nr:hypothetical protein [Phycisphaerae bacterium]
MRRASDDDLSAAVAACDAGVLEDLAAIFRDVDEQIRRTEAVCLGGGCCCRFALAGHRLYVTTAELALLLRTRLERSTGVSPMLRVPPLTCPYQRGPACHARQHRPLGCRTFFCRTDDRVTHALHEAAHARIRQLHETANVPYFYNELTAAIERVREEGCRL